MRSAITRLSTPRHLTETHWDGPGDSRPRVKDGASLVSCVIHVNGQFVVTKIEKAR
jgi:hypothetical protein